MVLIIESAPIWRSSASPSSSALSARFGCLVSIARPYSVVFKEAMRPGELVSTAAGKASASASNPLSYCFIVVYSDASALSAITVWIGCAYWRASAAASCSLFSACGKLPSSANALPAVIVALIRSAMSPVVLASFSPCHANWRAAFASCIDDST